MILIIWNSGNATGCARIIEHAIQEPVEVASSLHEGAQRLQSREYSAVVVDQWIAEAEHEPTSVIFDHLGMAVPIFVNFGISGVERILRELRAALSRRRLETELAHQGARQAVREELKDDVTALLLSCGVALEQSDVSDPVKTRLQQISQIAQRMKQKLDLSDEQQKAAAAGG